MPEPTSSLSSIEARISKLERLNRLYLIGICILISVIVCIVSIGAANPVQDNIRTKSVTIVDDQDVERGRFGVGLDGRMSLEFRDPDGVLRALMGVKTNGSPCLNFYDAVQKTRVDLSFDPQGVLAFTLFDKNGKESFTAPNVVPKASNRTISYVELRYP
jgi:hypothetical protein